MIINFRQGVISGPVDPLTRQPSFLKTRTTAVDLKISDPVILTIAHGTSDYLISLERTVSPAWIGFGSPAYPNDSDYYLYIDVHPIQGTVTFGQTKYDVITQQKAPANPMVDQHWFDLQNYKIKQWNGFTWVEKIRLFIAKFVNKTIFQYKPFGSQIGVTGIQIKAGRIMYDTFGKPVRKSNGEYFTTEDSIYVNGVVMSPNSLETRILTGIATEAIPENSIVRFVDFNKVALADFEHSSTHVLGFARMSAVVDQVVDLVTSGIITSNKWNWQTVNAFVWVDSHGELTDINPTSGDVNKGYQPPVGRVVSADTIRFQPQLMDSAAPVVLPIAKGGTGASTAQGAINNLVKTFEDGTFLRGDGANATMSRIQPTDVPILNQDTTGSARRLASPFTIEVTGDVIYTSPPIDGTVNVTAAAKLADIVQSGVYTLVEVESTGRIISGTRPTRFQELGLTNVQQLNPMLTDITEITSPGIVTVLPNNEVISSELNVVGLGISVTSPAEPPYRTTIALNSAVENIPDTLVVRNGNGEVNAIATTARKLHTPTTITISGDVTTLIGPYDGSEDVSSVATLRTVNPGPGTFGSQTRIPVVTVNEKGLVVESSSVDIKLGSLNITTSGNGLFGSVVYGVAAGVDTAVDIHSNAVSTDTPSTIVYRDEFGNFAANVLTVNELNIKAGTGLFGKSEITGVFDIPTAWSEFVGVSDLNLPSGTYVLQLVVGADMHSATISWYAGACETNETDEILLNRAGPVGTTAVFLRIQRLPNASAIMQIAASAPIQASAVTLSLIRLL